MFLVHILKLLKKRYHLANNIDWPLQYAENALSNWQFGLLARYTMPKLNKVSDDLAIIDPAWLEQFHFEVSVIEKRMKQDHLDQQANILAAARRVRDEILDSFSLIFHIYC